MDEEHKNKWGTLQAPTGEILDIAYVQCNHFAPKMTMHIIVDPLIAEAGNHFSPLDTFNLLDNN